MGKISKIHAREVLDSRGFPTIEVDVTLENGTLGRAIVPSGASTGIHEALELRDGDKSRYLGKGVLNAVDNVNGPLSKAILGLSTENFKKIDETLIATDGTPNKAKFGANAILGISLATAKAAAAEQKTTLAEWITKFSKAYSYSRELRMPVPLMNVINGGAHADSGLDIQEFMIVPHGFKTFARSMQAGCETFHHLKKILASKGQVTAVGDEGGFAPRLNSNREALTLIMEAIKSAGYVAGREISLALDAAASEFFKDGVYQLKDPSLGKVSGEKLLAYYEELARDFPLFSIEDGFAEDDWSSWTLARKKAPTLQWVGDDLFVTQVKRLMRGAEQKAANAILIKLNQVGTLTETLETMSWGNKNGYNSVVSHRSGETEDTTLAHLAVGTGCGQVKTGSASRSERMAKYNEFIRLEEQLNYPLATLSSKATP